MALNDNTDIRTQIEHWLFTIGYSLAFGTVLVKMWKVYQIFLQQPKTEQKSKHLTLIIKLDPQLSCDNQFSQVLKDWHLLVCILVITGVAVLLLLIETAVPQLCGSVTQEKDQEQPSGKTVHQLYS